MSLKKRIGEAQVALMLLTRLPAGRIKGEAPQLAEARWAFPFVGVVVGLLTWMVHDLALEVGAPPLLAAVFALAGLAMVTGALHFDGLADYADGIGGGRDKDHALEIMRDSRIGSYGVLAMIVVSGVWVFSVSAAAPTLPAFLGAAVLSRAGMTGLQEALPPVRPDGMARMAAGRSCEARAVLIALAVLALLFWPVPLAVSAIVICVVGWQARRRIGGQTGDVLGAGQLLSESAIWAVLACLV
ncbi:adenosylcobinamide-GDP ribazoletransferase [Rhodobacteraceae bacterium 63075]|nr:adenosylcobinamide-GDP ribazoletransferase [Rhodobacteraceae bacterium 63075]